MNEDMITSLLGNSGLNIRGLRRRRLGDNLSSGGGQLSELLPGLPQIPPSLPPIINDIINGRQGGGGEGIAGGKILPPLPPNLRLPPQPFRPPPPQRRPV